MAYTAEYKESAVNRVLTDGSMTIAEAAASFGLPPQTLRNWVKARESGASLSATNARVDATEMEILKLKAENLRLRKEAALLKKFNAFAKSGKF